LVAFVALAGSAPQARADLLVSSQTAPTANSILRYSDTGAFLGVFASGHGLADPLGMAFGPDSNLYVASGNSDQVLRFDGQSGAFLGVFASGGGLQGPINLTFGPDGKLYVSSGYDHILRFDGSTGTFIDAFVSGGRLAYPRGLQFGPDRNLYVVNYNTAEVLRYNGNTGAFIDSFVPAGTGGLFTPSDLAFGPDGTLYVGGGTFPTPGVFRYHGATGAFLGQFAVFPNNSYPIDFAFGPDHNLYVVAQGGISSVLRFNGQTGAFMDFFVPDRSGGLSNPFGIAFFPMPQSSTNHAPSITCPAPVVTECGVPTTVSVQVGDQDGDALAVVWTLNGIPVQTNDVPANQPSGASTTNLDFSAHLPLGTNILEVTATDSTGSTASCETLVTMRDTTPPVIGTATAVPARLWPPDHKMVQVTVNASVTDACEAALWRIAGVRSNEPVNGPGSGNTAPDWVITGDHTVNLRAERAGTGHGRTYWISIQATDASGNVSPPTVVSVIVRH
jgi:hypothetical protein